MRVFVDGDPLAALTDHLGESWKLEAADPIRRSASFRRDCGRGIIERKTYRWPAAAERDSGRFPFKRVE